MGAKHIGVMIGVVIVGAGVFLFGERILAFTGNFLVIEDKLQRADVIHVIAGPDERTDYAIQLYQQGYGKKIFFTGGWCPFHQIYHGQHGRERAMQRGVPLKAIIVDESPVASTYSEAIRLKGFIDGSSECVLSVIVVSDPYHMRRVRWTYRQVLGDRIHLCMAPVPFKFSSCKRHWWVDRGSRKIVEDEYAKILYYYARYRFSSGWIKDWLASLDRD